MITDFKQWNFLKESRDYQFSFPYGTNKHDTENKLGSIIDEIEDDLKDHQKRLKQIYADMEEDEDINNSDEKTANEYGQKINDMVDKIDKISTDLDKAHIEYNNVFELKEPSLISLIKKDINKNIDEIKKSISNFKDRTPEENAKLFKTRYDISGSIDDIVSVLKEIGLV